MNTYNKPGAGFWIIAIVFGLLWNAYGVWLFISDTFISNPESLSLYTEAQREMMDKVPGWMTTVYGIATISGLIGAILLVVKKKLAVPVFGISLITILINMVYMWVALNSGEVMGMVAGYIIPIVVIVIGLLLYLYSKSAARKGWLN